MKAPLSFGPSLAVWSVISICGALALGVFSGPLGMPGIAAFSDILLPIGTIWLNALQMTVIPLVVTQILVALVTPEDSVSLAGLGWRSLVLFVGLNLGAGITSFAVTSGVLDWYTGSGGIADALASVTVPDAALQAGKPGAVGLGEWLMRLIPQNPFAAVAEGNILQVLVFTVLLGAAINRLPTEGRALLTGVIRSLADAIMVLVGWILLGTPVGVFSLVLDLSLEIGASAIGYVAGLLALICGVSILVTLLLYPLAPLFGKASVGRFARAAASAQLVALSTQSSLAALPALVEGGRDHLDLPPESTGFVLPLSVSAFKMSTAVSPPAACVFFATVLGIPLGLGEMGAFLAGMILISFTTVGVPRGGGAFRTLPFFLAVGIPIEAAVIIQAIKSLYDPFVTVLNTTADMTVATLLSRKHRSVRAGERGGGLELRPGHGEILVREEFR